MTIIGIITFILPIWIEVSVRYTYRDIVEGIHDAGYDILNIHYLRARKYFIKIVQYVAAADYIIQTPLEEKKNIVLLKQNSYRMMFDVQDYYAQAHVYEC